MLGGDGADTSGNIVRHLFRGHAGHPGFENERVEIRGAGEDEQAREARLLPFDIQSLERGESEFIGQDEGIAEGYGERTEIWKLDNILKLPWVHLRDD